MPLLTCIGHVWIILNGSSTDATPKYFRNYSFLILSFLILLHICLNIFVSATSILSICCFLIGKLLSYEVFTSILLVLVRHKALQKQVSTSTNPFYSMFNTFFNLLIFTNYRTKVTEKFLCGIFRVSILTIVLTLYIYLLKLHSIYPVCIWLSLNSLDYKASRHLSTFAFTPSLNSSTMLGKVIQAKIFQSSLFVRKYIKKSYFHFIFALCFFWRRFVCIHK